MAIEILLSLTPPISRKKDISYLVILNNAKVFPTLSTKKKMGGGVKGQGPTFKVHMTQNFFISLFERAFKMMKNGIYFM